MDKPIAKKSLPKWLRMTVVSAILILSAAMVMTACAPAAAPEAAATDEPTADAADTADTTDATDESESADEATDEPVASDEAESDTAAADTESDNAADFFAADGEPTGEYNGAPVGLTVSGLPYRGEPDAPILLVEYSDYQCPYCGRHFRETEPSLTENYVNDGTVRTVFVEFPLRQLHPLAPQAHAAALCILDQGSVEDYWQMHGLLFNGAEEWGATQDPQSIFDGYAEEIGVDMDAFDACIKAGDAADQVDEWVRYAQSLGFAGTPSFQLIRTEDGAVSPLVGAQPFSQFAAAIDLLVSGGTPVEADAQAEAEIPFWATAEGWQPDPDRPGFNVAGDQYKGDLDAPVTVIEFSDFECPYCQQHALETQPTLDEQYVDTGDVLWVFKHFPLEDIHPSAPLAAVAAECATGQDMFWEFEQLLFENQEEWSIGDTEAALIGYAEDLGMDTDAFEACIADPAIEEAVNEDLTAGAPFVRGTPAFIVLRGEEGSIIPGALPLDSFSQILDEILAEVQS